MFEIIRNLKNSLQGKHVANYEFLINTKYWVVFKLLRMYEDLKKLN